MTVQYNYHVSPSVSRDQYTALPLVGVGVEVGDTDFYSYFLLSPIVLFLSCRSMHYSLRLKCKYLAWFRVTYLHTPPPFLHLPSPLHTPGIFLSSISDKKLGLETWYSIFLIRHIYLLTNNALQIYSRISPEFLLKIFQRIFPEILQNCFREFFQKFSRIALKKSP